MILLLFLYKQCGYIILFLDKLQYKSLIMLSCTKVFRQERWFFCKHFEFLVKTIVEVFFFIKFKLI